MFDGSLVPDEYPQPTRLLFRLVILVPALDPTDNVFANGDSGFFVTRWGVATLIRVISCAMGDVGIETYRGSAVRRDGGQE